MQAVIDRKAEDKANQLLAEERERMEVEELAAQKANAKITDQAASSIEWRNFFRPVVKSQKATRMLARISQRAKKTAKPTSHALEVTNCCSQRMKLASKPKAMFKG